MNPLGYTTTYFKMWLEGLGLGVADQPLANHNNEKLSFRCQLKDEDDNIICFVAALVPYSHTLKERRMECLSQYCSATFYTLSKPNSSLGVLDAFLITECVGQRIEIKKREALNAIPPEGLTSQEKKVWYTMRRNRVPILTIEEFRASIKVALQAYTLMENFHMQCVQCGILAKHGHPHFGNICWGVNEDANRMFLIDFNRLIELPSDNTYLRGVREEMYQVAKYGEPLYLGRDTRMHISRHLYDPFPPEDEPLENRLLTVLNYSRWYWEQGIRDAFDRLVTDLGAPREDYVDELKEVTLEESSQRVRDGIALYTAQASSVDTTIDTSSSSSSSSSSAQNGDDDDDDDVSSFRRPRVIMILIAGALLALLVGVLLIIIMR
jgi:hypothetical protein